MMTYDTTIMLTGPSGVVAAGAAGTRLAAACLEFLLDSPKVR